MAPRSVALGQSDLADSLAAPWSDAVGRLDPEDPSLMVGPFGLADSELLSDWERSDSYPPRMPKHLESELVRVRQIGYL